MSLNVVIYSARCCVYAALAWNQQIYIRPLQDLVALGRTQGAFMEPTESLPGKRGPRTNSKFLDPVYVASGNNPCNEVIAIFQPTNR